MLTLFNIEKKAFLMNQTNKSILDIAEETLTTNKVNTIKVFFDNELIYTMEIPDFSENKENNNIEGDFFFKQFKVRNQTHLKGEEGKFDEIREKKKEKTKDNDVGFSLLKFEKDFTSISADVIISIENIDP